MNWLAHIFLSDDNIEYQHGNLMADFLKGRSWEGASEQFNAGLKMHQAIDSFTDLHDKVALSQSRLGERGHLKGVVIDVVYDYLLAKNWSEYCNITLTQFVDRFHGDSATTLDLYPENAKRFLSRLIAADHFKDYGSFSSVERALKHIDKRLSNLVLKHESASDYLSLAKGEISAIEEDFLCFMPELIAHYKLRSGLSHQDHWLK